MSGNLARSLLTAIGRSYAASSSVVLPNSTSLLCRLRPLIAAANSSYFGRISPGFSNRGFATRPTTSSLSDPNPNWSNRPPKETILLDGCDFEHWLVVMEKPEGEPTRDEIIDSYIKTLATVVGSEEEARMKIYSVSTRHYFAFGALVSEELSYKIKELPRVRWVLPDSYLNVKEKDYGGEPFINGQAVPYDPKYHEEWVRNNQRANERNKRNDRPRNFDRSRNFERSREMRMGNQNPGGAPANMQGQPNMGGQPNYGGAPGNMQGQPNMGRQPNYGGPNNSPAINYQGGAPPTNNPQSYQGPNTAVPNPNYNPSSFQRPGPNNNPPSYPGPNTGGFAPGPNPNHHQQQGFAPNMGPPQGHNPNTESGYQNQYVTGRDMPPSPNRDPAPGQSSGYGPSHNNYAPNTGYQGGYAPNLGPAQGGQNNSGYAHQTHNIPGRDSHY